jgi:hypothetical protein
MNRSEWIGMAILVVWLGSGYLRVKALRRSGVVHSFGSPSIDSFLLLVSGVLLASALILIVRLFHGNSVRPGERYSEYVILVLLGGLLTWLCNGILRCRRRR